MKGQGLCFGALGRIGERARGGIRAAADGAEGFHGGVLSVDRAG